MPRGIYMRRQSNGNTCETCGDVFANERNSPFKRFCSQKCLMRDWRKRRKASGVRFMNPSFQNRNKKGLCIICSVPVVGQRWACEKCAAIEGARQRAYKLRLKREMIANYGGQCACCGEGRFEFLTIDHIEGRTKKEDIKNYGKAGRGGYEFYLVLKRRGYPKGDYRLLCYNCNCSMAYSRYCPHEKEKAEKLLIANPISLHAIGGK